VGAEEELPKELWEALVRLRDCYECRVCGSDESLNCHHVFPKGEGGRNTLDNGICLCKDCHVSTHRVVKRPRLRLGRDHNWIHYGGLKGQFWLKWDEDGLADAAEIGLEPRHEPNWHQGINWD
jgi:hypothetical protein